jgi:hypothetical protein
MRKDMKVPWEHKRGLSFNGEGSMTLRVEGFCKCLIKYEFQVGSC